MKKRTLALIMALVLMLSVAIPGTLAVSLDASSTETTFSLDTEAAAPIAETPAEEAEPVKEAPAEEAAPVAEEPAEEEPADVEPAEEPAEEEPADVEPVEEAPVEEPAEEADEEPEETTEETAEEATEDEELSLYERLMAAATAEEFDAIVAAATEEELVFTNEEFDALDDYYVYLTTGEYPDHSPVVDAVSTTVNFTNVAPLVKSVSREGGATVRSLVSTYSSIALLADGEDEEDGDGGDSSNSGLELSKSATTNADGTYTITLEAYATGSKIISSVNKDVPTDIVLVIDQSGSMDYCIVCGKSISRDSKHTVYTEVTDMTDIDTSKTYYVKTTDRQGQTKYTEVTYCNGTHRQQGGGGYPGSSGSTSCTGGAGWYTSMRSQDHTAENKYTPKTSSAPGGTQFYEGKKEACTSRLDSLKTAVTSFVDSVNTKAKGADGQYGTADDVNHRIAVVGFASDNTGNTEYENTELFIGENYYNYANKTQCSNTTKDWQGEKGQDGTLASEKYSEAFQNMNTLTGYKNVIASKNKFAASGGTAINLGTEMANNIFNAYKNDYKQDEKGNWNRNRVVIVFTDGVPGIKTNADDNTRKTYANEAISQTYTSKHTHYATVYTIGIFDGADASTPSSLTDSTNWNKSAVADKFMHLMSSNYLNAQSMETTGEVNPKLDGNSYYLSAGDSSSLNNIFEQIAGQIESESSSTTLDASAVVKDIIAPQFQLPEGATASNITLETYACTGVDAEGKYTWQKNDTALGATATVNDDKVDVTGFNFSENWVGTSTTDSGTTYRGNKLVIKFTVSPKDGFLGGNDVYTNTSAGVYENANATEPVQTFPKPTVNVPIADITIAATDKNVYLLGSLIADQIKSGATVQCGDVELELDEENYGLESWQTDYVTISVTYTDASGNTITSLSDLEDDTTYTVTATVSPKTDGSTTEGTVATKESGTATGKINVFTPELTFKDSEVYYGDTAPTDYSGNKTGEVWKHGETKSTDTGVDMLGTKPELTITYTPESSKIKDGKINSKGDIAVDVTVKIGGNDVTTSTSFEHTDCTDRTETLPEGKEFLLHVKTCSLTITKAAGDNTTIGSDEYFVFNVKKDGAAYTQAVIQGTGEVTLSELPVGTYTVEEDASTAWRYTSSMSATSATLSKSNTSGTITCTNTKSNDKWLNHFASVINTYGDTNNKG